MWVETHFTFFHEYLNILGKFYLGENLHEWKNFLGSVVFIYVYIF